MRNVSVFPLLLATLASIAVGQDSKRIAAAEKPDVPNAQVPQEVQRPVRINVDWAVEKTLQISGDRPVYPALASVAHIEGGIRIQFVVGTDGLTKEISVLSGHALLIQATINAASSWKFKPTVVGGVPVEVETITAVLFFLEGHDASTYVTPFRQAVEKHPKDASAREAYARALLNVADADASVVEFRQLVALEPNKPSAHFGLGDALGATADVEGAISEYRQGISIDPKDVESRYALANWLERKGDLDGAADEYREALRMRPKYANQHYNFGLLLMKKGDVDGAIVEYKEALHEGFDLPETHYQFGLALEQKGDSAAALKEYSKAIKERPDDKSYGSARDRLQGKTLH